MKPWRAALRTMCLALAPALSLGQNQFGAAAGGAAPGPIDVLQMVNRLRGSGCAGAIGPAAALQGAEALSQAARLVARGAELDEALKQAHYRANTSMLLALRGFDGPGQLAGTLEARHCAHLLNPQYTQLGLFQQRAFVWLVLAEPFSAPAPQAGPAVAREVLDLVNAARGQARLCGSQGFQATGALRLNPSLSAAAMNHARDMAGNDFFDHAGSDGSTASIRVTRTGYPWRAVGENIASGQGSAAQAVQGWLKSPGHCANLMAPGFTEMGLAFAANPDSAQGIYWVQVFATMR